MYPIHPFAAQVMVELMEDNEGVNQYVTVLDGYSLVFGGVAAIRFNLVFFG